MSNAQLLLTFTVIGVVTFFFRFSFIYLYGRFELPQWLVRSMKYVPPAVLSALVFPAIMVSNGDLWISFNNPRLVAGVVALVVAWRIRSLLATILVGFGVYWLLIFL